MKGSRGNPSRRTLRPEEPHLPPGYHLDYSDPSAGADLFPGAGVLQGASARLLIFADFLEMPLF